MEIGERIVAAIARIPKDHDLGIIWDFDERKANTTSGPNCLAGFAYADGEAEHLDRAEAIARALELMASASERRTTELALKGEGE